MYLNNGKSFINVLCNNTHETFYEKEAESFPDGDQSQNYLASNICLYKSAKTTLSVDMYLLSYGLLCHPKLCTKFAYSLLLYGLLCYLKQSTTECIYLTLPFVMI